MPLKLPDAPDLLDKSIQRIYLKSNKGRCRMKTKGGWMYVPCPGSKLRSKGKGRGLGIGKGRGPIGKRSI